MKSENLKKLWENPEYREHMKAVHRGKKTSEETKKKMSDTAKKRGFGKWMKGKKGIWSGKHHSDESRKKMSISKIGKQYRLGKTVSEETRKKLSESHKGISTGRGKPRLNIRGEKSVHWKGGITPINKYIRNSLEYKLWRKSVFERDNWTCVWCGKIGGELNADHIKPFALFPELRLAIDNGRTLCVPCHETTDTYKGKTKKLK